MTRDWDSISVVLDGGWPQTFDVTASAAYQAVLSRFPLEVVWQAVCKLAAAGSKFRPSVGEIAAECRQLLGDLPALPWADVWAVCEQAAHQCGTGMANGKAVAYAASQGVDTANVVPRNIVKGVEGNTTGAALAVAVVRARLGDGAAGWFAAHGRAAILSPSAQFGDDNWGLREIRKLGESYGEYIDAEPQRQARASLPPSRVLPELEA